MHSAGATHPPPVLSLTAFQAVHTVLTDRWKPKLIGCSRPGKSGRCAANIGHPAKGLGGKREKIHRRVGGNRRPLACCLVDDRRQGRRHRQDWHPVSADWQCRGCRPGLEGRCRNRRRDHQQSASGTRQPAARRDRGPAQPGRREARADLRRSPGQSVGRPAAGAAPHHPGQGECPVRRVSVLLHVHGDAGRRALRHPVRGRRFRRAQHHRPRPQSGCSASRRSRPTMPRPTCASSTT